MGMLELLFSLWLVVGYISARSSFPQPLSAAEEKDALERLVKGDREARRLLIEHNLRLVAHIAKKYTAPGCDADDLISIGAIGLIKAVDTYRPGMGTQLSTYAARCVENEVLGKPVDEADAARMIRLLSGRSHWVYTGVCLLLPDGTVREEVCGTEVCFAELDEDEILRYAASGEPLDKAGGYGIQGYGALLVKEIAGDFYSVMGLPVAQTARMLAAFSPANP